MRTQAHEKRERILDALTAVMASKGYEAATIADIAREAGLAPGLLHYYFSNKLEILLGLLNRLIRRHDLALEAMVEQLELSPLERLYRWIDFHLGLGATQDTATLSVWVVLSAEALRQEDVRAPFSRVLEREVARTEGWIRILLVEEGDTDARAAAAALVALVQGYYLVASASPGLVPPGSAAQQARLALAGVLKRPLTHF